MIAYYHTRTSKARIEKIEGEKTGMGSVSQSVKEEINKSQHLSGYELTTQLIRGGLANLELNTNAKLVLLYLATCYNEQKGIVYPRQSTMAAALQISERGIVRALKELISKGLIMKTKRGKNKNVYVITSKVLQSGHGDTSPGQNDTSSSDTVSLPCKHELKQHEVEEQQQVVEVKEELTQIQSVVVPFKKSSSKKATVTIDDVPPIIRNNKKIENPCAYWASLDDTAKAGYLQKQAAEEDKQRIREENKRAAALRAAKAAEEKRIAAEQAQKPLDEQFDLESAAKFIWNMRNLAHNKKVRAGMCTELATLYNLDIDMIITAESWEVVQKVILL